MDSFRKVNDINASKDKLTLGTSKPVVHMSGTGMMRVNFDARLTTLIREARAMSGYGIELSADVRQLATAAGALVGRAKALQQLAQFHNTIGDRMVQSQRPLMLSSALGLARAVQQQSGVTWSDAQAVDAYIGKLKDLVRQKRTVKMSTTFSLIKLNRYSQQVNVFAQQNTDLNGKHAKLAVLTGNLLTKNGIDLAANQNLWTETLRTMRIIVDNVDAEYGNSKTWKLHWDRQLLKALGVAYR